MNVIQIKAAVRQRDGFRCLQCGLTNAEHVARHGRQLEVHRVIPGSVYSAEPGVCRTLCRSCHGPQPKRKRGQRFEEEHVIMGRLSVPISKALDAYFAGTRPTPPLNAVIRVALEDFLRAKGFWPPSDRDEE